MKTSKYSDSQIAHILKKAESGALFPAFVKSIVLAVPHSTNGAANTQAWMLTDELAQSPRSRKCTALATKKYFKLR